ncbi:hypothetical protein [Paenibacillus sp. PAMC21692]|uniref:hypothetical protein n=1 Tax=Paenibacillus sp. PAMC21692 TaxID=2762320 RepID=UPI00164D8360|nr:hypothetical protein [Paenibacillus sp. PAMC21692]QNK57433.1 hypothetical protein H7F31_00050 [Paenibacillus sp. PAMC21692]
MLQINELQDLIDARKLRDILHESAVSLIDEIFNQLRQSLDQESASFRLSDHGYKLFILMPDEHLTDRQLEVWFSSVEYTERIFLGDCVLIKICLMEDNESFTFLFSVEGTQTEYVEKWLRGFVEDGGHL